MARNTSTLTVKIVSDASAAARGFDDAESRVDRFRRGMDRASVAAGAGLLAIGALAKGAVDAASALEQSTGAVQSVFGDQARAVQDYADTAADANNLSRRAYQEMAAVVGSQLKNMGVAHEQLAPKTDELIDLGSDLAATFGGPASDAIAAISSLLRGERDPIERYGIAIKAADVEARLAAQGLEDLEGEARKAAEMQATLNLLFEQSAGALGATAREADTAAGATENLKAKWEDAQASLGEALLPILVTLATHLATAADWLQKNEDVAIPVIAAFAALAVSIWAVNIALYANPIVWIIGLLVALGVGLYVAYQRSESFRNAVDNLGTSLASAFRGPISTIRTLIGWVEQLIEWVRIAQRALSAAWNLAGDLQLNPWGAGLTVSHEDNRGVFGAGEGSQWAPIRGAAMSPLGGGPSPSSAQGTGQVVNITVNGALDPQAVADQIAGLLRRRGTNLGLTPTVAL